MFVIRDTSPVLLTDLHALTCAVGAGCGARSFPSLNLLNLNVKTRYKVLPRSKRQSTCQGGAATFDRGCGPDCRSLVFPP